MKSPECIDYNDTRLRIYLEVILTSRYQNRALSTPEAQHMGDIEEISTSHSPPASRYPSTKHTETPRYQVMQ